MNALRVWMQRATPAEKEALAKAAGIPSVASLHQMAGAYRTGGRPHITSEIAGRIEQASRLFEHLPPLCREDLSPACSQCELAKIARLAGA
jgi:hypothetical protein